MVLYPGFVRNANALKLFGMTIFGSDEPEVEVINPVKFSVVLEAPAADKDLKESLKNSSMLVADAEKPVSGDLGLVIKARDDRDRLIAALYEKARYGGLVRITIAGQDIDTLPPNPVFNHSAPVPVRIDITPGPVFTLGNVKLEGDAAGRDLKTYGLTVGSEAGSLKIIRAGDRLVSDLKSEGRPLARLTTRQAIANHDSNTVDIVIGVEGGPVAPLGAVAVQGQKSVDPDFIRNYSRLNGGQPYSPETLRKASDRLRQLGVFSSVTVREANKLAPDGSLPLTIEVSEGKHRYFGLGAQVSTTEGAGFQGYWGHRNLFGKAEALRIEGSVSRLGEASSIQGMDYSAGISFTKPGVFHPSSTFKASLIAKTEHPDSYEAKTITAAAGFSYELNDTDTASAGLEVSLADTDDAYGNNKYLTTSIPLEFIRDTRDNKLDPTMGFRAAIAAKPSYEAKKGTFFSSFEASATGYKGLGAQDRVIMAGKLSAGVLVGASDLQDIPATRRFYAGGGGSVRGYSYQEISPYNNNNDALGGRSYVLGSVEARIKITDTIGIVPFLDAGVVSSDIAPDFSDIRAGAGIGLRYATPFGPLRLDVAMPLKKYDGGNSFGIYAGIGQAF
jgi:translocation and assembly module TamA